MGECLVADLKHTYQLGEGQSVGVGLCRTGKRGEIESSSEIEEFLG
jgi:hypothetical protein